MLTNLIVNKGDTDPDIDLIYMKPLPKALSYVLPWYFEPGKKILDVTAGQQRMWQKALVSGQETLAGEKCWKVTFLDGSPEANADVFADFSHLPFADDSFDCIVFDPPFTNPKDAGERFGLYKKRVNGKTYSYQPREGRMFYFRNPSGAWIPPEEHFKTTWKEFNRVSRNGLIIKISERYEKGYEIPVTTYMDLCYDHRLNPLSEFKRVVQTGYRGNRYKMLGARMIHPQRVLTYYAVYKKNYKLR